MQLTILEHRERNLEVFKKLSGLEARIFATQEVVQENFVKLFDHEKDHFQIIHSEVKHGVSISMKKYFRSTETRKLFVNKKKFYLASHGRGVIKPMIMQETNPLERKIIYERFPYLEFLEEWNIGTTINSIFKHNLFTPKKALAWL